MGILNIFKKKDRFDFDSSVDPLAKEDPLAGSTDSFGGDEFKDSLADASGTSTVEDPLHSGGFQDPLAGSAEQPLPPRQDVPSTPGQQLAHHYIANQQPTSHSLQQGMETNHPGEPSGKNDVLEMINLKLDAIKSQLDSMNQRLIKIESDKKRW